MRRRPMTRLATLVVAGLIAVGCADETLSERTASASPAITSPRVQVVSPAARAAGLIDVRTVVPDALIDLRYATTNNFVGVRLYPPNARCLVHESMGAGLRRAAQQLRRSNEVLVFWDCYRPHSAQQTMYEKVPNPAWVAAPGPYSRSHESGRSVDITLAARRASCAPSRRIADRCLVEMGTDFDSFTPRATAYATNGVSVAAQRNRARLRGAMTAGGLSPYSGEWWHFDGAGAGVRRPIIDVPPL
ncbi:M15 family metallopeptidase [Gordonia sp. CPCC 205515]|uniref:M15 family metallopeptidase n=1 Tax=Gordonia sp. CPCC 205515 TaxID=3140791 RepID=UPI003AF34598